MQKKAKFERWEHYKSLKGITITEKEESSLFSLAANSELADYDIEEIYEAYHDDIDSEIADKREAGERIKRGRLSLVALKHQGWK